MRLTTNVPSARWRGHAGPRAPPRASARTLARHPRGAPSAPMSARRPNQRGGLFGHRPNIEPQAEMDNRGLLTHAHTHGHNLNRCWRATTAHDQKCSSKSGRRGFLITSARNDNSCTHDGCTPDGTNIPKRAMLELCYDMCVSVVLQCAPDMLGGGGDAPKLRPNSQGPRHLLHDSRNETSAPRSALQGKLACRDGRERGRPTLGRKPTLAQTAGGETNTSAKMHVCTC